MPTLTQGQSVDLTITGDCTLAVQNPTGHATVEHPIGKVIFAGGQANALIDVRDGAARVTAVTGGLYYEVQLDVERVPVFQDPATGALVGVGQAGARDLYPLAAWDVAGQLNTQRLLEKFSSRADWTYSTSGAVARIGNAIGRGPYGAQAMRFATDAGGGNNATVTKDLKFNLDSIPGLWLLSDVHHRQTASQIGITLYTAEAAALAGPGRFQLANPVPSSAVSLQPYWLPKASWSVLDGSPSWANDQLSLRVRIDSNSSEPHDWSLVGLFAGGARPTVIITQDDGWESSYTIAHAACRKRGIPQSHFLIAGLLGAAGYITLAQAQEMRAAGDYLGLHGAARWDQDVTRIAADVAALQALGIDTQHAAYPEGQIGAGTSWQATQEALRAAGVLSARMAGGNSPTLRALCDPLALTSYPLNNSLSAANAIAAVDAAIASGGTLIFYGHKYGASADGLTWTTADLNTLLDYLHQKRLDGALDVTTIDRWIDGRK